MKSTLSLIGAVLAFSGGLQAATLQLTTAPGAATILNSSTGTPLGGAAWGIVVDTSGNGFANLSTSLQGFNIASGFIGGTDNYFYLAANTTLSAGIVGAAAQIIVDYDAVLAVEGSQSYKIIWFDTADAGQAVGAGTLYGLSTATGTLPASNAANPSPTDFHGANGNASIAVVPEPSTAILGAVGALALLRRRRN